MKVFELLREIQRRPTMFVGASNADRGQQLKNIELLLNGYALAVKSHDLNQDIDFPREFGAYLHERFGWSASAGPVAAVRDAAKSDDDAWQSFWVLVEEFRVERTGS